MGIVKQMVANAAWGRSDGANAILDRRTGPCIHLQDSADAPLDSLTVYGRCWQEAAPTQATPQEIHAIGEDGLRIVAANGNLADLSDCVNAFILSDAPLGEAPQQFPSAATNLFQACAWVIAGQKYIIRYVRGATPASANGRAGLITNDAGEVVQHGVDTWYSDTNVMSVTPAVNGWLWVAADINTKEIAVYPAGGEAPWEEHQSAQAMLAGMEPLRGIEMAGGDIIADTLTFYRDGTGQILRRIGVIASYAGETVTSPWMSTTGALSIGATVIHPMEPVEETLSAAQIRQLMALKTFQPYTNLSAADGPVLEAAYKADLKTYVDKKLASVTERVANLEAAALA